MNRLEREMIECGKLLFERRLISGWGGNLSCRAGKGRFVITGQHAPLGFLTPKDLVRIDGKGKPVQKKQHASSETPLHLAVYGGTEAQAIVHVHPPMVLAFSLTRRSFVPISYEEKYTIGEVPVIAQETPTVTKPEQVVEELRYHPIVILQGHGTVAIGKNFQEAVLLTDLLEEAVHCQFFKERLSSPRSDGSAAPEQPQKKIRDRAKEGEGYVPFSRAHMTALMESANNDPQFRAQGNETGLTTSLTLHQEENDIAWTVHFVDGGIARLDEGRGGEFMISGKREWWAAIFQSRMDPFLATQQGKLKLTRGEMWKLSRWFKPFQRAFSIWQTIPTQQ